MLINKEKQIARKIVLMLNKRGFIVKKHYSKTSKSIYIKIDKGLIPAIRISDHKKYNNDNCKFNIVKNYYGLNTEIVKGKVKKYYRYNNIARLIADIELERSNKILSIGYSKYRNILLNNKNQYNGYFKVA